MTAVRCLFAVCDYLGDVLKEFRLPGASERTAPVPVKVYPFHLPEPEPSPMRGDADEPAAEEYEHLLPAVVVRAVQYKDGEFDDDIGELTLTITVGAYSHDPLNREGPWMVLNLLERIRQALLRKRVIDDRFETGAPMSWELYDERTRPLWFGEMTTTWAIMEPARIVPQDFAGDSYGGDDNG